MADIVSHPTRGAWIEMQVTAELGAIAEPVAPYPGCVD